MSKTLNNIEGFLFPEYSKRKLKCISKTYEELSQIYQKIPLEQQQEATRREFLYQKQIEESRLVFAQHLKEISGAVGEVADTVMHVSLPVEHKRKLLIQFLKKQGISVKELVFLEQGRDMRKLSIVARLAGRRQYTAQEMAGLVSVFFDKRLVPCMDSANILTKSYDTFLFENEPKYTIMSAVSRAVKEGEKISGDNYSIEDYQESEMVMMIADGMGSGEQACKDSEAVIEFMEKFLEAGFQAEKAFAMVNAAIAAQTQCCNLTTLDVCTLHLRTGEAEFLKAGAASSFCKRGHIVSEVSCDALPLGSFSEICPMTQSIQLMDGDMLIMLSDGILDCFEDKKGYNRMKDVIARYHTANPKDMSDYLLQYAITCQGGRIRDDMTVLVSGVWTSV